MSAWWAGITPAEARIECEGATHVLRWEAGALTAADHGDPDDEATLAALAGTTYPCLEHLAAWHRRREDPRVLAVGSRGAADPVTIDLDDPRRRHLRHHSGPEDDLVSLLALGGALPARLQANVAATWARRLRGGHRALGRTRPQLQAALYGRALAALRAWFGEPELTIELDMVGEDAPRGLARSGGADSIAASLPFAWLSEVWVRDLTLPFGRFCLAAAPAGEGGWTLETVAADLVTRETLEISVRAGG